MGSLLSEVLPGYCIVLNMSFSSVDWEEELSGEEMSGEDDESSLSVSLSEESEEDNYAEKLSTLQDIVASVQSKVPEHSTAQRLSSGIQESSAPSDFGFNPRQKLTVADLLPTITNSDPRLRKSLKLLDADDSKNPSKRTGIPAKLHVPLPKRQQNRLDRAAAYDKSKETLDRWMDSVKHNRRAEHLSFPLADPTAAAAQGTDRFTSTTHSQPLNDLESTIQDILQKSGLASSHGESPEGQILASEELQTSKRSLDEVQARRAELRKARDLLFREEVRAKRIKKIKSKSFRRVHRKQRERAQEGDRAALAAAGVPLSDDDQERIERRRAEERMGARHRESKWAKGIRDSGRAAWDEDARTGVTEMAKRGEELRRRIEGKEARSDEDDRSDSGSETSETEDDEGSEQKLRQKLDLAGGGAIEPSLNGHSGTGLSSMRFMQKAEAALKQQNDAHEQHLLAGLLEQNSTDEGERESGNMGRRKFGPSNRTSGHTVNIERLPRGELEEGVRTDEEDGGGIRQLAGDELEVVTDATSHSKAPYSGPRKRKYLEDDAIDQRTATELHNPWLDAPVQKPGQHRSQKLNSDGFILSPDLNDTSKTTSTVMREATRAQSGRSAVHGTRTETTKRPRAVPKVLTDQVSASDDSDTSNGDVRRLPRAVRNQELILKAFAGDEVVANFEQEKQENARDEDEKVVDNTLPGWGNWTGAGISKKEQKRSKGRFLTTEEGIKQQNRKDLRLERVIISEKRVKKVRSYLHSAVEREWLMWYDHRTSNTLLLSYRTLSRLVNSTRGRCVCQWVRSGRPRRHSKLPPNRGSC